MKAFRTAGVVSGLMAFLAWSPVAHAAARVFVSVSGADTNDCSVVTTPCRTFGGGITQVDAGGEVIVLTSGSYGGVTITKAATINVPTGIVAFTASTITVNAGVSDVVTLRGITLKALTPGSGIGIDYLAGAALYVENCVVNGFLTGLNAVASDGQLFVTDTIFKNHAAEGIFIAAAGNAIKGSIDHSRFEKNQTGIFAQGESRVTVKDSVFSGGVTGVSLQVPSAVSHVNLDACLIANNSGVGLFTQGSTPGVAVARIARSIVTNNGTGLQNNSSSAGSAFESSGNSLVRGNTTNKSGTITVVAE